MMLTVRPLRGVLWKEGVEKRSKAVTVLQLCFLPEELCTNRTEQKSCAWFGLLEHILKRAGTENRPVFNGCILVRLS